jgi:hypothetical protein
MQAGTLLAMWRILLVFAVALLATAAAFDWRARRRGEHHRTDPEYWRAAGEARREERRAHTTRYFDRFLPKR